MKKKSPVKYKIDEEVVSYLVAEQTTFYGLRTYISLFSSAGVGCYGFKDENYHCIATVELIERRLKIQQFNNKCVLNSGYICGDMTKEEVKQRIFNELKVWQTNFGVKEPDVIIATPPCQGMSVANHKKKDELGRNSLVVESIKMVKAIKPKFFIFENVPAFLKSICTDVDGIDRPIGEAIDLDLGGEYNIYYRVVNFKDYGCPSSRTRTLVIGTRKDLNEATPLDVFPSRSKEKTLREVIGHLPSLKKMGEITPTDIYHSFREYSPHMQLSGSKSLANIYKQQAENKDTNNIFAFFIEKALRTGKTVALIVPKSLVNAPEFNTTREVMNRHTIKNITDFGEKAFRGVKIETISFVIDTTAKRTATRIESYITEDVRHLEQDYLTSPAFPYWLLYRNSEFDKVASCLRLGIFKAYRDRKITKTITKDKGSVRVLKSRNIGNGEIIDIEGYDCFVDDTDGLDVAKFMNKPNCVLVPNLTYYPRACLLPADCIADGSVAILQLIDENDSITAQDLEYFATDEFCRFYAVARNRGTRSLNIDNNSVYFFGKKIRKHETDD